MTDTERKHQELLSLQANEALRDVLAALDSEARDALVTASASDADTIRDHQAMARAIKNIRERIGLLAATTAPKGKPGLA